jgi:ABC-type transport system substrate-binding protein
MYALANVLGKQVTRQVPNAQWNRALRVGTHEALALSLGFGPAGVCCKSTKQPAGPVFGLTLLLLVLGPWTGIGRAQSHATDFPGRLTGQLPGQKGAPAQQTLSLVIDAEPTHLNPLLDPDLWGYRISHDLLCEPLLRRRPSLADPLGNSLGNAHESSAGDSSGQPFTSRFEPVLAERFRLDADGRGIELWLRKNVRFQDGRPFSAQDVRATLDMVRSAGGSAPRTQALLADVVRVQVLGPEQIRIDLRRGTRAAVAAILEALSEIDILPQSYFLNGRLIHQPFNRHPVCTGPYRFVEWRRGTHIVLRRFTGYWGPPALNEELRFRIAPDGAQGLSLLRQGAADVLARVMPRYLEDQVLPMVQRGRWRKVEIDANQVVLVLPNGRHPVLGLAPVRRALALLLAEDRDRLVRDVRKGMGTPLISLLSLFGQSAGAATLPAETPEALLDQAGMTRMVPDGPRQHNGEPLRLRLLFPTGANELQEVARRLGESLGKQGMKLEPEAVDFPTFSLRLTRGAFELALCAWSWTGDDSEFDVEPLLRYALPLTSPPGAELLTAFARLREGASSPPSGAELLLRWQQEAPLFPLYRPRQVVLLGPQVEPARPEILGDFLNLRRLGKQQPTEPQKSALFAE